MPDLIQDKYQEIYGEAASRDVLRFCKAELAQAVWLTVLDEDVMHAYEHGMLEECGDGVKRRGFPRFFTHGTDYPERYAFFAFSIHTL